MFTYLRLPVIDYLRLSSCTFASVILRENLCSTPLPTLTLTLFFLFPSYVCFAASNCIRRLRFFIFLVPLLLCPFTAKVYPLSSLADFGSLSSLADSIAFSVVLGRLCYRFNFFWFFLVPLMFRYRFSCFFAPSFRYIIAFNCRH